MSLRSQVALALIRIAAFVGSLPVVVMRPDDLIEFSRQSYADADDVESWAEDELVDSGLSSDELDLLSAVPATTGELLLLGIGGGREAIPLARMGFQVTGVDYVPALVERASENAARRGVSIQGLVQEFSRLDVPPGKYDVVWLSSAMYSCVPTHARRVAMLRRIAQALKPGGLFLCQYHRTVGSQPTHRGLQLRRLIAAITQGNVGYEPGDVLWGNIEFVHTFSSVDTVRSELEEGGFTVVCTQGDESTKWGGVVCRKAAEPVDDMRD